MVCLVGLVWVRMMGLVVGVIFFDVVFVGVMMVGWCGGSVLKVVVMVVMVLFVVMLLNIEILMGLVLSNGFYSVWKDFGVIV